MEKIDVRSKIDELYQEYLRKKLDLIFNGASIIREDREKEEQNDFQIESVDENNRYIIIKKNGKYNIMDIYGRILSPNKWFDFVSTFRNGYATVKIEGKGWNYIDTNGQLLFKDFWLNYLRDFYEGYALVYKWDNRECYYVVDIFGRLYPERPIYDEDEAWAFLQKIRANSKYKYISGNFIKGYKGEVICCTKDLKDYEIQKVLLGFKCSNTKVNDSYNIKYQPIKVFGIRYTLCLKKEDIYLYDRINNEYKLFGNISNIEFDDNFIFDKKNNKVYLIYENKMIEITEYYNKYLKNKDSISINSGITDILTREDFSLRNMEEIDKLIQEDKEKMRKQMLAQEATRKQRNLEEAKKKAQEEEKLRRENEKKELENLLNVIKRLKELEREGVYEKVTLEEDDIFIEVEDYKEINKFYIETGLLRHIDFSRISLNNVKIDGIDFRGCNIVLKPQEVYEKDLKNCNFEGIYISPLMNFTGVDIRGSKFSDDSDPKTIDGKNIHFKDAIYDETTTYNGIPFTKIYGECRNKPRKNK